MRIISLLENTRFSRINHDAASSRNEKKAAPRMERLFLESQTAYLFRFLPSGDRRFTSNECQDIISENEFGRTPEPRNDL